jgi:hypothetical protein
MANVNSNEQEDLSITLIERRKRLHELANEINRWEDDSSVSNKKYKIVFVFFSKSFHNIFLNLKIERILFIYHKHKHQQSISQINHRHPIISHQNNITQAVISHHWQLTT